MSNMSVGGLKKPVMHQAQAPKPQVPAGGHQQKPDLSAMYSQVAQNALKTKPHH